MTKPTRRFLVRTIETGPTIQRNPAHSRDERLSHHDGLKFLVQENAGLTASTLAHIRRDVHMGDVCGHALRRAFEAYQTQNMSHESLTSRVGEILRDPELGSFATKVHAKTRVR